MLQVGICGKLCLPVVTNEKPRFWLRFCPYHCKKRYFKLNDIICQLSWVDIWDIFGLAGVFWQIVKSKSLRNFEISKFRN